MDSEEAKAAVNMMVQMAKAALSGAPIVLPKMDANMVLKITNMMQGNPYAHLFGDLLGRVLIEGAKPCNAQAEFIEVKNVHSTNMRVDATHAVIVEDCSEAGTIVGFLTYR